MRRIVCAWMAIIGLLGAGTAWAQAQAATPQAQMPRVSLDDLYGEETVPDTAISPSGRYLALVQRHDDRDELLVVDLEAKTTSGVMRIPRDAVTGGTLSFITAVAWKSDERLVFRTHVGMDPKALLGLSYKEYASLGDRLFAIGRDGRNAVRFLADNRSRAMRGTLDLGDVASFLPRDPDHVLMAVNGRHGPSLFKVSVLTGEGEPVEEPNEDVVAWWIDIDGKPVVRVDIDSGSVLFFRKQPDGSWKQFYKIRVRDIDEQPEYVPVGPSDQDGKYYVLARPEGADRTGLYLYDLEHESFGEVVYEHPQYDLAGARIARDGKTVTLRCYYAHAKVCEFSDPSINAHMKGLRKFFAESANVTVTDSSDDLKTLLLYVEGPDEAPSYYYYRVDERRIEFIGSEQAQLAQRQLAPASVVEWKARDGLALSGYLTWPVGARDRKGLPLVVYPHGGPESRDILRFDPWPQYLAARGYAVFQPNFRGSDGFGKKFAESGYRQWGLLMQQDIDDGIKELVARGTVDAGRVCIVGASYGGYAALAGVALTPDQYRCAVAVAGVSDLDQYMAWVRRFYGAKGETYAYWSKAIGDPQADAARLAATSPARLAANIRVPVLLIHGTRDIIVPPEQSELMQQALAKVGHPAELLRIEGEGHSRWSDDNEKLALIAIDRFLWTNIGPGVDVVTQPPPMPPLKKR